MLPFINILHCSTTGLSLSITANLLAPSLTHQAKAILHLESEPHPSRIGVTYTACQLLPTHDSTHLTSGQLGVAIFTKEITQHVVTCCLIPYIYGLFIDFSQTLGTINPRLRSNVLKQILNEVNAACSRIKASCSASDYL